MAIARPRSSSDTFQLHVGRGLPPPGRAGGPYGRGGLFEAPAPYTPGTGQRTPSPDAVRTGRYAVPRTTNAELLAMAPITTDKTRSADVAKAREARERARRRAQGTMLGGFAA